MRTRLCLSVLLVASAVLAAGDALPEGYGLRILSEPLPGVPTAPAVSRQSSKVGPVLDGFCDYVDSHS